jgi:hypothetical protein
MATWDDPYAYNAGSAPVGAPPDDGRAYLWDGTQWVVDPQYTYKVDPTWGGAGKPRYIPTNPDGSTMTPAQQGVPDSPTDPYASTTPPSTTPPPTAPSTSPTTTTTTTGTGGGGGGGNTAAVAPSTTGTPFDWASKPAYRELPEYQAAAWETPTPFNYGAAPTRESIYSNLQSDPGYQFRLQQGLGAMQNAAISKGIARTGGTMKGLIDYAGNFASQEGANAFDQALRGYQTGLEGAKTAWDTNYGAMRDRNLGMQTNAQDLYKSKLASTETASKNAWDYWKYMADRSNDWDMMKYKVGTSMM